MPIRHRNFQFLTLPAGDMTSHPFSARKSNLPQSLTILFVAQVQNNIIK